MSNIFFFIFRIIGIFIQISFSIHFDLIQYYIFFFQFLVIKLHDSMYTTINFMWVWTDSLRLFIKREKTTFIWWGRIAITFIAAVQSDWNRYYLRERAYIIPFAVFRRKAD